MSPITQTKPVSGDYYGVVYKGGPIIPILIAIVLAIIVWWFFRKRRKPN